MRNHEECVIRYLVCKWTHTCMEIILGWLYGWRVLYFVIWKIHVWIRKWVTFIHHCLSSQSEKTVLGQNLAIVTTHSSETPQGIWYGEFSPCYLLNWGPILCYLMLFSSWIVIWDWIEYTIAGCFILPNFCKLLWSGVKKVEDTFYVLYTSDSCQVF
jgi:hypothetical protein